jgi:hypothetical protein
VIQFTICAIHRSARIRRAKRLIEYALALAAPSATRWGVIKRPCLIPTIIWFPVHPRVCGEHVLSIGYLSRPHGSSPRVRGTLLRRLQSFASRRFIPACAGNTEARERQHALPAVHPRVCGEHISSTWGSVSEGGSSPRVRGTHNIQHTVRYTERFIPACAGNTDPDLRLSRPVPVHPRVCGEHLILHALA